MIHKNLKLNRQKGRQPVKTCVECGKQLTKGVLLFKCCPDCNSRKIATLAETGEKFCKSCGLVLL